ncbi:hypothetical protein AGABI2DRAFT_191285 [Agaricus bisporus var. bisporus H97]|uniref:hypothetical protein n=1 Tax=Agaricus bisporus var. bisporus (strain H97 / ATCC MYA-4626 / FGSC 10389) TaxID=936046 RepID=UPI00029F69D8|nr:hypothetical protein AGABI2DRAFT_191285 [Agaricus bisporus var. bisporus H97]EKV49208.1 hypothetical protein AGABI2DRAFT_191285 [Agaricus bisporus var. bisporus H97]
MPFNPFDIDSPPQSYRVLPPTTEAGDIGAAPCRARQLPHYPTASSQLSSRHFNMHSQPSDLPLWEYKPIFGLIHSLGVCSVCTAYASHVATSINQADASIIKAMKTGHEHQDIFFMDGFGEGLRHKSSSTAEVTHLKEELNTTKHAFEDCVAENELLRSELDQVKLKLFHIKEESRQIRHSLLSQSSPIPSLSPPSLSSSHGTRSPGSSIGSSLELQRNINEDMNRPQSKQLMAPLTTEQEGTFSHPARQLSTTYASVVSDVPQIPHTYNITSQPSPNATPSISRTSNAQPLSRNHPYIKYPRTMKELKDLMDLAHEQTAEGVAALSIVKSVCSRAHGTPRESKSFMQRWVLMNWKNPYAATTASATSMGAKANPRIDDSVDVWFDYLCTHPHSWPKGVRKDAIGRPVMSDLIANRAVARMRPTESAAMRNDFISHVTDMFAVPGMYQHLLERNNFTVASEVTYNTFSGIVTPDTIAQHFADSGFMPEDAEHNFEPWAKYYKKC